MTAHSSSIDPRTPILVGVGTAHGPESTGAPSPVEPLELMSSAALAALTDAGAEGLARRLGSVAVPVGNWSYVDPGREIARRLGAPDATTIRVEVGVPQQTPVRVAVERIRAGTLDAALILGGEAKATQLRCARSGEAYHELDQGDLTPDERWEPEGEIVSQAEIDAGMWQPVEQYACIDNALRSAEGRTVDEHLDDIAALWARFNQVAGTFDDAAFPEPRDAAFLRDAGPGNRLLAFPYAKWHSTQWAVDQAAAMVLCSAGLARDLGVPLDRWVFPQVLVESSLSVPVSKRAEMHRWPAMRILGEAAAAHVGRPLAEIEHAEVYSCFPAAVRVQQRELGLPLDGTPTVMGGMAFAGGPFNNFTYQSTAAIVAQLRAQPGTSGMVTTVSGLLTKPAVAVWSTDPGAGLLVDDLVAAADAATSRRDAVSDHHGDGVIATYTVTSTGSGEHPAAAFVIADLDEHTRWVGTSAEPELAVRGAREEIIGRRVRIDGGTCVLA
jgi:acetyl-CoA C-acetyltransferase